MEWLLKILEEASENEDGKVDIKAIFNAIQKEFPNHAVSKEDFDAKAEELKTANKTITDLKKENKGSEELQKKIKDYEKEIENLQNSSREERQTYALKEQLSKAGVIDPDYLIYKAGGVGKFVFDKENNPIGVEDVIKPYRADKSMAHLFKQEQRKPGYSPQGGEGEHSENPFAKETFNMTKQGEMLRANPEQARAMAAAAGVNI